MKVTLEYLEADGTWTPEEIDLPVADDLSLDDNAIDAEMCNLPTILSRYGVLSAELKAQAERKKQIVENIYSSLSLMERKNKAALKERVTEAALKEIVINDSKYQKAVNAHIECEKMFKQVDNLYRSLNKKADIIIALCHKQRVEIQRMGGSL
jgi:hypothetical protein